MNKVKSHIVTLKTRMHSNRMCTIRPLTVGVGVLRGGGPCPGGWVLSKGVWWFLSGGVSCPGGVVVPVHEGVVVRSREGGDPCPGGGG